MASKNCIRILIYIDATSEYGHRILRGVLNFQAKSAQRIKLRCYPAEPATMKLAETEKYDGILAQIAFSPLDRWFASLHVPCVNVSSGKDFSTAFASVIPDHRAMGALAADHLLQRGFMNFICIQRKHSNKSWVQARNRGFIERVKATKRGTVHLLDSFEDASKLERIVNLSRPAGIFLPTDALGKTCMEVLKRLDLGIPDEVSIIAADNHVLHCESCNPPLSSVIAPIEAVGETALQLLLDRIANKSDTVETHMVAPCEIAVRRSSDAFAIADREIQTAVDWIRRNIGKPMLVSDLIQLTGLSRRALDLRFKHSLGHAAGEEIRLAQLAHARSLLSDDNLSIKEIAVRSGYSSSAHFVYAFKQRFGKSPGVYRDEMAR